MTATAQTRLGAQVPSILSSRANSVTTRLDSRAVAALVAKARREMGKGAAA
jgi:phosphate acetyltransferase